jgi:hypothetical protein
MFGLFIFAFVCRSLSDAGAKFARIHAFDWFPVRRRQHHSGYGILTASCWRSWCCPLSRL